MALTSKKHEAIHGKTGNNLAAIKASFDNGEHTDLTNYGPEAAIIYQMQKMQDELDYLRTEISANKDKTGITSGQANAITANTAKVSLAGGSATTISFGELITTSGGKGQPSTYTIVMTAVKGGVSKTVTLTLT
jgi:hypothetical protein|tara:strand:- start:545 stop:946 length:402 start_codon:yes stop_codon:yes gene_type:complete